MLGYNNITQRIQLWANRPIVSYRGHKNFLIVMDVEISDMYWLGGKFVRLDGSPYFHARPFPPIIVRLAP